MGMDKYGCFIQYMFITCFIGHRCFSKNVLMSIRHIKKHTYSRFPLLLFLCSEQFTDTSLFTFSQDRAALLNMQNLHLLFIITFVFLSVPHTVIAYFDAAIFSIKLFSFIYLIISVVRQRDEYEIMTETRPIKTRLHNQLSLLRCSSAQKS